MLLSDVLKNWDEFKDCVLMHGDKYVELITENDKDNEDVLEIFYEHSIETAIVSAKETEVQVLKTVDYDELNDLKAAKKKLDNALKYIKEKQYLLDAWERDSRDYDSKHYVMVIENLAMMLNERLVQV